MLLCVSTQIISDEVIKSMTDYANMEHLKKTAIQVYLPEAARASTATVAT